MQSAFANVARGSTLFAFVELEFFAGIFACCVYTLRGRMMVQISSIASDVDPPALRRSEMARRPSHKLIAAESHFAPARVTLINSFRRQSDRPKGFRRHAGARERRQKDEEWV